MPTQPEKLQPEKLQPAAKPAPRGPLPEPWADEDPYGFVRRIEFEEEADDDPYGFWKAMEFEEEEMKRTQEKRKKEVEERKKEEEERKQRKKRPQKLLVRLTRKEWSYGCCYGMNLKPWRYGSKFYIHHW